MGTIAAAEAEVVVYEWSGHIPIPTWVPLTALGVVLVAVVAVAVWWHRRPRRKGPPPLPRAS